MQTHASSQVAGNSIGWTFGHAREQAKRFGARIVELIDARADAHAAAPSTRSCPDCRMLSSNAGVYSAVISTGASSRP